MKDGRPSPRTAEAKGPYAGYHRVRPREPDPELTRVGRGTPCGEYLRRFWQPVALASELTDVPLAVRIMGEDLVLFRDGAGRLGLLDRHCSHRNTSLEYGKIQERGIRCCYHGWHYDIDGRVLETPGEPATSRLKDRVWHGAYPTHEYKGIVFAFMGPPERKPAFPIYDAFEHEGATFAHRKRISPCNWLQVRENEMDPVHLAFLHSRLFGIQFQPVYGALPTLEWIESPIGMLYMTVRRWNDMLYLRTNDMIMPNVVRIAGIEDALGETLFDRRGSSFNWVVPIDDTHTLNIGFGDIDKSLALDWADGYRDRMARRGAYTVGAGDVGQTGEPSYEERQRAPGDWDAWVSQGPVSVHAAEHLGSTDQGVAMYRRLVREGIRAAARGDDPPGVALEGGPAPILTYCNNTVARVPRAAAEDEDRALALDFGRAVTRAIMDGRLRKDSIGAARPEDWRAVGFPPAAGRAERAPG